MGVIVVATERFQMSGFSSSITLVQLNYFHKLAETRHFTDAARQLYITQPTLSAAIKSLETELGVSLVYRGSRRNVRLTKQGEEFDAKIEPLLTQLQQVIDETSAAGAGLNNALSVGTIPTIQYDFLPEVLRGYWDTLGYDKRVFIAVEFTNSLIKGLKDQEYDIVFCSRVPEESNITFVPILHKALVAVVASDGPYADMDKIDLTNLTDIPFATYRETAPIGREVRSLLNSTGCKLNPSASFDDEFSLAGYVVASGDVVGLMLDTFEISPFRDKVKSIPIVGVPADWHPICMAYDNRLIQSDQLKTLIKIVKQHAADDE